MLNGNPSRDGYVIATGSRCSVTYIRHTTVYCHTVTQSHRHTVTQSHCHTVTRSHCHTVTRSHCHTVTPSHSHTVTLSHGHTVTLLHCHTVTTSHRHTVTLTLQLQLHYNCKWPTKFKRACSVGNICKCEHEYH